MITEVFFAADIDAEENPVNISDVFSADTTQVYVFITWSNIDLDTPCESVWFQDNVEFTRTPFDWFLDETGSEWLTILVNEGDPIIPGSYRWEIHANGKLIGSGEFVKK